MCIRARACVVCSNVYGRMDSTGRTRKWLLFVITFTGHSRFLDTCKVLRLLYDYEAVSKQENIKKIDAVKSL